jgi:predicted Zn finger-like uncharacterized protein
METRCPNCDTLFRITATQLEMAQGMVRCGYCQHVFDASIDEAQLNVIDNENQLDVFNQAEEIDDIDEALVPDRGIEQIEDEPSEETPLFGDIQTELVPDDLRTESARPQTSTLATVAWSFAILLMIGALIGEYIWFNRYTLVHDQRLRPITNRLCEHVNCEKLQLRDPSKIEMLSRNVYTHPNQQEALMITTTMVNHADYAQPYPSVQIDFSNVRGELLASRRFTPEEYLNIDADHLRPLQPGAPITFGMEIKDPGKEAITYEFSFH